MKKILMLLMAVLPLALASCSDKNDLPDVDFEVQISGGVYSDGSLYVVQGQTLTIDAINVTNREAGKAAAITSAAYYWDGYYLGTNLMPPYGFEIETTAETPLGRHLLEITAPLIAVDKEVATSVLVYDVYVVADATDLPTEGTTTFAAYPRAGSGK